jgi:formylmethanofuran dehydrogenase subunit C
VIKKVPAVGLEVDVIDPANFSKKELGEIERLEVWAGRRTMPMGEAFEVSVQGPEEKVEIHGDASRVKRIGQGMASGRIDLFGDAGMHLGNRMSGGEIHVSGSVSSWCGCEMQGGSISISGNAAHYLGGAYRGSSVGMQGGTITVRGTAGGEAGCRMADGIIIIGGGCGDFAGVHQKGGVIVVHGPCGARPGAGMSGGLLILNGRVESILPGAAYVEEVQEAEAGGTKLKGPFLKFKCDLAEETQGELLILAEPNRHLRE